MADPGLIHAFAIAVKANPGYSRKT